MPFFFFVGDKVRISTGIALRSVGTGEGLGGHDVGTGEGLGGHDVGTGDGLGVGNIGTGNGLGVGDVGTGNGSHGCVSEADWEGPGVAVCEDIDEDDTVLDLLSNIGL